jgi:DNA-binding transcriptional MerR regulator/uncharacterized cupin superfamily protein
MAYTVKEVAAMSGVSGRTLHFYDEIGLLKPARYGENGYRYYEEPQLLALQQILFYRELGFELKQIHSILARPDFERVAALESHREVLEKNLARTQTLLDTIDKTIAHLRGAKPMPSEEIFRGFSVSAGKARFEETIRLAGAPNDCKVSAMDTNGALCVFEFSGAGAWPRHSNHRQDEWLYVIEGEVLVEVGKQQSRLGPGESIFFPREVAHAWASDAAKVINLYQPAGKMEEFFRRVGQGPPIHEVMPFPEFSRLFEDHGMELLGPPLAGEWKVEADGRIIQTA